MRKWNRMSCHKLRNRIFFSHHLKHSNHNSTLHAFCKQIHVSACHKFCFRNNSLSTFISGRWFKRCLWLRNVNIDIAFNYSCAELITRLWRCFDFVIPHLFSSSDGFLVLTFSVGDEACLKPMSADLASFS